MPPMRSASVRSTLRYPLCYPLPWRALVRSGAILWLVTRTLALVETYLAQTLLRPAVAQSPQHYPPSLTSMINSWRLWDGGFFRAILWHGYSRPADASTWPLYPLLAKPLELVLGPERWQVSLLLVSNLAALAAFILLGALAVQEEETLGAAHRAMQLLAAAPLALFLTAAYTESLFLALAIATLLCARRGAWWWAALWAFLAALTRPVGFILVAPLVVEYARQLQLAGEEGAHWRDPRIWLQHWSRWRQVLVVGASVPAAVGSFSLFNGWRYGDPLAWIHEESLYGHVFMWPWQTLGFAWRQFTTLTPASFQQGRVLLDLVPLLAILLFTLATIRRIPLAYTLYLAGLLLACTTSPIVGELFPDALPSVGRYLLPAAPVVTLVLAHAMKRYPWLETPLIGGGFALQALLVAFVINGGWLV